MKKIYLCGHTGSMNRGCEAIIRSTTKILDECGANNVSAYTFNFSDDSALGLDKVVELISYPTKTMLSKAICFAEKIFFKTKVLGNCQLYSKLYKENNKRIISMNIGGDTYCYGTPNLSFALNRVAKKRGFPNIFWGCSVDETALKDANMQKDLNRYSDIVVRETLSQEILKKVVKDDSKIHLACDPAFNLPIIETQLPENFKVGNTVGINLSPMVFKDYKDHNDVMYNSIYDLIDAILQQTDMNVCLVPHVYNVEKNLQDSYVLSQIYNKYIDSDRVSIVDKELSCTELKYIISNCRFFIGARTHATIAAYSTSVPTIALSYSIKSLGIAKDLFGQQDNYVVRWQSVGKEIDLKDLFFNFLVKNEDVIRNKYSDILPNYKQSIYDVTKEVLTRLNG